MLSLTLRQLSERDLPDLDLACRVNRGKDLVTVGCAVLQVADRKDLLLSVIWVTLLPRWVMIDMPTRKIRLLVR